jgi:octaprenyl-diphosphate synthase
LLVGDFIFVKLLKLVAPFDQEILCSFADASIAIVEGETRQALSLGNLDLNEESYLRIVKEKTAALFSASAKMGALAAEAPDTQVAALRTYGLNLGIAFQIRDDTLDVTGKRNKLGKPVGNDLGQNKMSLATIFAREKLGEQYDTLCRENRAEQLLREIGALGYAMGQADRYIEQAKEALAALPHSEAREALFELADFAVSRFR